MNITTVLTPQRRREEFRGQLNGLLAAGGHQVQLQAVAVHEAEWTLALHTPQQSLNASLVLQDLKSKALLGVCPVGISKLALLPSPARFLSRALS